MTIKHFQNIRPKHFLTGIVGVSFVTILSALLLFVTNNPLQQTQDDRSQTAIPEKKAEIKITPANSNIVVGNQSSFTISGSTGGFDSYGFQFVATIDTTNITNLTLTPKPQANLAFPVATITAKSGNQSEIVIFATNPSITSPVNVSEFQDLAVLSFKAENKGSVVVSPQDNNSKVLDFRSESSLNMLKPMSGASINITAAGGTTPTPTPDPTATPNPTATPTPTATPNPTPLTCNNQVKTCSDNSTVSRDPNNNCEFRACPTGGVGGNNNNSAGTLSSCNQYCASSNDCGSSLVCWYNQCRNPLNVESPSCANKTVAQNQAVLSSCNQSCSSHRDCATSLLCYYGACRAATNPTNTSCNPVPAPTPTPTPVAKGNSIADTTTAKPTPTPAPTATTSAVIAIATPMPTATPGPLFDEPVDESALGAMQQYVANFWNNGDRTQVMIIFGLALLMVVGLITLLISLLSPRKPKVIKTTHRTPPPTMPPPTLTMQR